MARRIRETPGLSCPLRMGIGWVVAILLIVGCSRTDQPEINLIPEPTEEETVQIEPAGFFLGGMNRGETKSVSVEVKRVDGEEIVVTETSLSENLKTAKISSEQSYDRKATKMTLEFRADSHPREIFGQLTINVAQCAECPITVPIVGRVVGDIIAEPWQLDWVLTEPNGRIEDVSTFETERKVSIRSRSDYRPFVVQGASSDVSELRCDVQTLEGGQEYEITAKITTSPAETRKGNITVTTNLPNEPTLTIPIVVHVLKPWQGQSCTDMRRVRLGLDNSATMFSSPWMWLFIGSIIIFLLLVFSFFSLRLPRGKP